jgi:hypothetical protein
MHKLAARADFSVVVYVFWTPNSCIKTGAKASERSVSHDSFPRRSRRSCVTRKHLKRFRLFSFPSIGRFEDLLRKRLNKKVKRRAEKMCANGQWPKRGSEERGKLVKNVSKRIFITRRGPQFHFMARYSSERRKAIGIIYGARSASNYAREPGDYSSLIKRQQQARRVSAICHATVCRAKPRFEPKRREN